MSTKKSTSPFPIISNGAPDSSGGISRRGFLKALGSAAALGATGCADSADKKVMSDLNGDMTRVPGVAQWFSSTCRECEAGCGILVKTREGRAIKIEGNPLHPVNRGGVCAIGHSALQHTYDPDRIRQPIEKHRAGTKDIFKPLTWNAALKKVSDQLSGAEGKRYFLSGPVHGTEKEMLLEWCEAFNITPVVYNPSEEVMLAEASRHVFGEYALPEYSFENVEAVLSFGADFLETWINPTGYSRQWAATRRSAYPAKTFHVEPRLSLTGSNADLWMKNRPGTELSLALSALKLLLEYQEGDHISSSLIGSLNGLLEEIDPVEQAEAAGITPGDLIRATRALYKSNRSLVVAGGAASSTASELQLQIVVHLMNVVLGNIGKTVFPGARQAPQTNMAALEQAISDMNAAAANVGVVFIKDTNPLFNLPDSYGLQYALKKVPMIVSFSSHMDETTSVAHLVLPSNTPIESWGDGEPVKGVNNLQQPSMKPVFDTRQFGDMLIETAKAAGKELAGGSTNFLEAVKARWQTVHGRGGQGDSFDQFWLKSLERGGYFEEQSAPARHRVAVASDVYALPFSPPQFEKKGLRDKGEGLVFMPYQTVKNIDGRGSNRPWLQELPDPITKVVWDVWAEIHPETAKHYGLKEGDVVQLSNVNGEMNLPLYITPYVHPEVVAVPLGEGHTAYGRYATTHESSSVYKMLPHVSGTVALMSTRVSVGRGRGRSTMVETQGSKTQMGRGIGRTSVVPTSMAGKVGKHDAHDDHHGGHGGHHEPAQLYQQRVHPLYEWGMAIDLASCTGCSACVVACYSENNIAVVGKDVCSQGREMSWLRIERYYDGDEEKPQVNFVPMLCQHCHNAPCEPVCPVYATYHTEQGLNAMIYNRCVGTRYCGNNCSYKVRRFNWFEFDFPEPLNWQLNPDVTKRAAGVMEKCSFCVQRINGASSNAKDEGRAVRDGEIQPACVQSCPTEALAFGNLNDPNSRVSRLAKSNRAYKILDHHLNTQPAISYLEDVKYNL